MSKQYPGGIISKTAPTPSGPYSTDTAPGIWTLEQQAYWQKLGQWPTAGNVNPSAFIENLFSTYLYTGNGSTQTITNGIDLAGKGGLVWGKSRSVAADNVLVDSARGIANTLVSNSTGAQNAIATAAIGSFNSNGFSFSGNSDLNANPNTYASWTFRKQPKFFDVVTYTGNGTTQNIAHSLGSEPGCVIVKETSGAGNDWQVYHRATTNVCGRLRLNLTNAETTTGITATWGNNTSAVPPTSTVFTVGSSGAVNASGATYVAYLFAHNAGGFGLTGTDNVISCGSFTTDGSGNATVNLGYEPQWVMIKRTDSTSPWFMFDTMRGFQAFGPTAPLQFLEANSSAAEAGSSGTGVTATGFQVSASYTSASIIYIAIRRGPMKVPTSGTSVYGANTWSGAGSTTFNSFAPDWATRFQRNATNATNTLASARLTGETYLITSSTAAETPDNVITFNNAGGGASVSFGASGDLVSYFFKRAPSFFDVVCYTGTGVARTVSHNLGVVPEMMIVKSRSSSTYSWAVYHSALGATQFVWLNDPGVAQTATSIWNNTSPTSSVFTVGTSNHVNNNTATYVAYLFASCPGVSKVGSYTGTGTTKQIDCGFTGGARFVLIKRTDSTGDWYVWDSARGIVAGNDPYLLLNSTAAEVTNTDYVDTYSAGFEISSTAPAAINANGGTFIFLAIA